MESHHHHENHCGGYHGSHPRRGPWRHHHGPNRAIQGHDPSHVTPTPKKAQCVAEPSPSLAPTCATRQTAHSCGPACSRRAAHPRGLACFHQAAHFRGLACFRRAAHSRGPACSRSPSYSHGLSNSPSRPKTISTIRTYHRAGGILTIFLHGFGISQLKSRARSLPPFHCSRRHIPSKLFQSKWRTTLVSTSHRVDERPSTTDDLGKPVLAMHQDATCPKRGVPKKDKGRQRTSPATSWQEATRPALNRAFRQSTLPIGPPR